MLLFIILVILTALVMGWIRTIKINSEKQVEQNERIIANLKGIKDKLTESQYK
ncbi:hypothetical protein AJ85_19325 [Alkalihalobacillus alcalophilus ATCC 27647 = CGMCC 1.3604]|uniref:Uncharacterized protein n=1 Tax=Alkalihalobacillus alcalophilus ATCC 27647 = CGMCC 1.3604 TaxID=1218173 RepID=A0A4V3X866_ALKAL|nr:hypothetical protein [Alkalihalobacillus alcalophilus]MED1561974.1 hypothetical protein [Alkalihalobacillus alcalophilus]THG89122.1 hypothetical protein AJ85_19325 [Alkalihalobacillus alcalophilus ATCC 27647 = CGMCC 1.3604]